MYVGIDIVLNGVIALYSRYEQNTTKMPHKFNVLTQNIQTLCLSVGGHMHGRTHARTHRKHLLNILG
jgi:hypothetical protein